MIRLATLDDAPAIAAIYGPIVRETAISFEVEPPSVDVMRDRIRSTLERFPWLVDVDEAGAVAGYAHAGKHRDPASYQWSANLSVYVRADSRRGGVGAGLYRALLAELDALGYCEAFAGIALPNSGSVALHESVGFRPIGIYRRVGHKFGAWHDVGWWQRTICERVNPPPPRRMGEAL